MAEQSETFAAIRDFIVPLLPPLLGAYFGTRYSQDLTVNQRFGAATGAAATGWYVGAAIAEYMGYGVKVGGGLMFLCAMFSHEAYAVAIAFLRQWQADPQGAFRKWWDTIRGRNG